MSNWLQKFLSPPSAPKTKSNLPAEASQAKPPSTIVKNTPHDPAGNLPPAAIVYGVAAGAFFAFAIYLMIAGHWVDGALTLLPAAGFVGFAMHMIKDAQPRR